MFKSTLTSLLLLFSSLVWSSVDKLDVKYMNVEIPCLDEKGLIVFLNEFEEKPFIEFQNFRGKEMSVKNQSILFINEKTKSWSMVEKISSDMFCIVSTGDLHRMHVNPRNRM